MEQTSLFPFLSYQLLGMLNYSSSIVAANYLQSDNIPWAKLLQEEARALQHQLAEVDPVLFCEKVEQKAAERFKQLLEGIVSYAEDSYVREKEEALLVWQQGSSRLLHYSAGK